MYVITFILSFILVYIVKVNAKKFGFMDSPNNRSTHTTPIPRSGGIGFIVAFFVAFFIFKLNFVIDNYYIFLSILLIFALGIYDDKYTINPKGKFVVIFLATIILYFGDIKITNLGDWASIELNLGIFSFIFTFFAIAGFTNAINLIDGLDGLATSISIIILSTFLYIGIRYSDFLMIYLSSFLIVTLLGFLLLNWNPAKVFMGDSGSLSVGFILSILSILSISYIHPVGILYMIALPILDTLIVMIRRIRRGTSPFTPDRGHIHHIILNFFEGSVKKSVFFLSILQIIFSIVGFLLISVIHSKGSFVEIMALIVFILMLILFYMIFTGMYSRQNKIESLKNK